MNDDKKCLTKADLVELIFTKLSIEKNKAIEIVESWLELVKVGLEEDSKVMISGFGVFEVKSKNARPGRNPQTGGRIILPARKVVSFKPSQILVDHLNRDIENSSPPS